MLLSSGLEAFFLLDVCNERNKVNIYANMVSLHMCNDTVYNVLMVLFSVLLTHGISSPFFINCQKKSYYEEIVISYFAYEKVKNL